VPPTHFAAKQCHPPILRQNSATHPFDYKALEGAGMFLDRATGVLFFMVSPPGMWDDHSELGQGPG